MEPSFKAYCYLRNGEDTANGPLECSEVSFQATPDILRKVSAFMIECAEKIEMLQSKEMSHFHLQDEWKKWNQNYPDVIVVSPVSAKD